MTLIAITTTSKQIIWINPEFIVCIQQNSGITPIEYEIALSNGSTFEVSNLPPQIPLTSNL